MAKSDFKAILLIVAIATALVFLYGGKPDLHDVLVKRMAGIGCEAPDGAQEAIPEGLVTLTPSEAPSD